MSTILVAQNTMHGMDPIRLVELLRDELPTWDIEYARTVRDVEKYIEDAVVIISGDFPIKLVDKAENLKLFVCTWAGVDHIDIDLLSERNISVINASGVHGPNIAEYVLGWFLAITRNFEEALEQNQRREWRHYPSLDELNDSTVCVIGLGSIGQTIVDRLSGFDLHTRGVRYSPEKGGPTDEIFGFENTIEALSGADYVAVACPLTEETHGLIGHDELSALASDAILTNVGRGPVIDTDALVWTLQKDIIHAAVLDVTDPEPLPQNHPLWALKNCYITPHNAGHTPYYWERVVDLLSNNLEVVEKSDNWNDLENQII